jgi:hypothetical protein
MRRGMRGHLLELVACVSLTVVGGCTGTGEGSARGGSAADSATVAEARAFMEAYAIDLRAGNREAIVARYDTSGTWLVGHGLADFTRTDSLRARYAPGMRRRNGEWRIRLEDESGDPVALTRIAATVMPGDSSAGR